MERHPRDVAAAVPIVSWSDIPSFCQERFLRKITEMNLINVDVSGDLLILRFSAARGHPGFYRSHGKSIGWVVPTDLKGNAALQCNFLYQDGEYLSLLDQNHPVVRWLCLVRERAKEDPVGVEPIHIEAVWKTVARSPFEMDKVLERWNKNNEIASELKPPTDENGILLRFEYADLVSRRTLPLDHSE
jgi:hypothetical protein